MVITNVFIVTITHCARYSIVDKQTVISYKNIAFHGTK